MDFARDDEDQARVVHTHRGPLRPRCEPSQTFLPLFLQSLVLLYYFGGHGLTPKHILVPLCGSRLQASTGRLSTYKCTSITPAPSRLREPVFPIPVPISPRRSVFLQALSLCLRRSSSIQHPKKTLHVLQEVSKLPCPLLSAGANFGGHVILKPTCISFDGQDAGPSDHYFSPGFFYFISKCRMMVNRPQEISFLIVLRLKSLSSFRRLSKDTCHCPLSSLALTGLCTCSPHCLEYSALCPHPQLFRPIHPSGLSSNVASLGTLFLSPG